MNISWMDLETLIQSELSQKEKNKYHINAHVWNLEKQYRYYLQNRNRDTDIENKCMDTKEGKVELG